MNNSNQTKYAGFGIRFLAYWVDYIIIFLSSLVIQQLFGNNPFAVFQAQSLNDLQKASAAANSPLALITSIGFGLAYYLIFLVGHDGATPGKKLLGIKIIKASGEKLTYLTALIRYFGYFISSLFY